MALARWTLPALLLAAVFSSAVAVSRSNSSSAACSLSPPARPKKSVFDLVVYCSEAHKKCFDRNTVWFEGKCYTVGSPGPCRREEILVIDKEALIESMVIKGKCQSLYQCDEHFFLERMAHDRCCYDTSDIEEKICSSKQNLGLRKNVFGEGECEPIVAEGDGAAAAASRPRLLEGFCYFPAVSFDFKYGLVPYERRFPSLRVAHALANLTVGCSARERGCFEADRVLFAGDGRCYPLLEQGPCPQGSWLVLDEEALRSKGAVAAVCKGPRCPLGQLFLAREQRCHSLRELQTELCAAQDLLFDVFGAAHCARFTSQKELLRMPRQLRGDTCALGEPSKDGEQLAGQAVGVPLCGLDDTKNCRIPVDPSSGPPEI